MDGTKKSSWFLEKILATGLAKLFLIITFQNLTVKLLVLSSCIFSLKVAQTNDELISIHDYNSDTYTIFTNKERC